MSTRRLFALDQNFPTPIVQALEQYVFDAELVPVSKIDPRMARVADWELILALAQHERPWDGLITTDSSMLKLPRELAAIMQTNSTVIATEDAGHDPIKATGLLFAHLGSICKKTEPKTPQVWTLKTQTQAGTNPWELFKKVAEHQNVSREKLQGDSWLSAAELKADPLKRIE